MNARALWDTNGANFPSTRLNRSHQLVNWTRSHSAAAPGLHCESPSRGGWILAFDPGRLAGGLHPLLDLAWTQHSAELPTARRMENPNPRCLKRVFLHARRCIVDIDWVDFLGETDGSDGGKSGRLNVLLSPFVMLHYMRRCNAKTSPVRERANIETSHSRGRDSLHTKGAAKRRAGCVLPAFH